MNLKKKMKGFFTLTRKADGGFTLVELIVVIAILAILAGVAVPAYSGYITQTNKQADITLVKDIEYALTLAGYNKTFADGESGALIISTDPIAEDAEIDENLEKALTAAFGSNYRNTLKLKYNGWSSNGMLDALLNSADPKAAAQNVLNSSYLTGNTVDGLLTEVEGLTSAAAGLANQFLGNAGGDSTGVYEAVSNLFQVPGSDANAFEAAFDEVFGENGDPSKLTQDQIANLMVMASAKEMTANPNRDGAMSGIGGMVNDYAMAVAFASSEAGKANAAVQDAYNTLQASIASTESLSSNHKEHVTAALGTFFGTVGSMTDFGTWMVANAGSSVNAFNSILSAVNNAELTPDQLGDGTLFTEGKGAVLFKNYVAAAEAISQMDAETINALKQAQTENAVVITYSQDSAQTTVTNTLPAA